MIEMKKTFVISVQIGNKVVVLMVEKFDRDYKIPIPKSMNLDRINSATGKTLLESITSVMESVTDFHLKSDIEEGKENERNLLTFSVDSRFYPCYDISNLFKGEEIQFLDNLGLRDRCYCPTNDILCKKAVHCKCNRNNW